ncbi:MAG: hypothetical protein JEY71_02590 [Sphaerochaeta sp.]|nr:hypothetical protein [Sphaerochaeta sp.]
MKKLLPLLILLYCTSLSLFALDVVTLCDATVFTGEVSAYSTLGKISIREENGTIVSFSSLEVLSIEKLGITSNPLAFALAPYIHFHAGQKNSLTISLPALPIAE